MDSIAKNMKVMRGALTRWLLPYDNNTRLRTVHTYIHAPASNSLACMCTELTTSAPRRIPFWSTCRQSSKVSASPQSNLFLLLLPSESYMPVYSDGLCCVAGKLSERQIHYLVAGANGYG